MGQFELRPLPYTLLKIQTSYMNSGFVINTGFIILSNIYRSCTNIMRFNIKNRTYVKYITWLQTLSSIKWLYPVYIQFPLYNLLRRSTGNLATVFCWPTSIYHMPKIKQQKPLYISNLFKQSSIYYYWCYCDFVL